MHKNIGVALFILSTCSFLGGVDIVFDDETPLKIEYSGAKKTNKPNRISQRGFKYLNQALEQAIFNENYVNIACVYLFSRQMEHEYHAASGMVWIGLLPCAEVALFTMGFGMLGAIPLACASGGLGFQARRYKTLKKHAQQALVSIDNNTFQHVKKAITKDELHRSGMEIINLKKNASNGDQRNQRRYHANYEGLKDLLKRQGYDVSGALLY